MSLLPVVLVEDDVPGAKLAEPLVRHTICELSWWIECRGCHPPPTSATNTVYCREVRKIMAANPPVINICGSCTERKQKVMQEAGLHVEPFIETSAPPFPLWVGSLIGEKLHAEFHSFQGIPCMTTYRVNQCNQVLKRFVP